MFDFERARLGIYDKNGKELREGDDVYILYTDWPSKSDSDKRTLEEYLKNISIIGWIYYNVAYAQFRVRNENGDIGDLLVGPHGQIIIA